MIRRRLAVLAILLCFGAAAAAAQAPPDSLEPFLKILADSTDATFGRGIARFDTTGIDSLIRAREAGRVEGVRAGGLRWTVAPALSFHRATGVQPGLGVGADGPGGVSVEAGGSYGFANRQGRYRLALSRPLADRAGGERGGGGPSIEAEYARETVPFAAEHAAPFSSAVGAFFTGRDRQSVYARRGGSIRLLWSGELVSGGIGWRAARDASMPVATRFTVWGSDRTVPPVDAARAGSYREGFGWAVLTRPRYPYLGAEGRFASRDRWRARVALAQSAILPGSEAHVQLEGGAAARAGPPQDRFELGGPLAVPSLGFGDASGDRLLLGKIELVHGIDLFRALHVRRLSFLALHPALFAHGGAAWTEDDGRWTRPPRGAWRAAAGVALVQLPGFPTPETYLRLQVAWPVGLASGVARFSLAWGRRFDLIPQP